MGLIREVEETLDLYMLVDHRRHYTMASTLYKVEIVFPLSGNNGPMKKDNENKPPKSISPVVEFPAGEFPIEMSCAQLGSKLYFLGGGRKLSDDEWEQHYEADTPFASLADIVFPPEVHVLDIGGNKNNGGLELKRGLAMNTGKPCPLTFVANGMIYVLGGGVSLGCNIELNGSEGWALPELKETVRLFERYNPEEENPKWEVLPDPPFVLRWMGSTVIESQDKVLITAWCGFTDMLRLVFHIGSNEWEVLPLRRRDTNSLCDGNSELHGRFLYGIGTYPYVPSKLGPFDFSSENNKRGWWVPDCRNKTPLTAPSSWTVSTFHETAYNPSFKFRHLGGGYFCYVNTGQPWIYPDDHDYNARIFKVTLFKDWKWARRGSGRNYLF